MYFNVFLSNRLLQTNLCFLKYKKNISNAVKMFFLLVYLRQITVILLSLAEKNIYIYTIPCLKIRIFIFKSVVTFLNVTIFRSLDITQKNELQLFFSVWKCTYPGKIDYTPTLTRQVSLLKPYGNIFKCVYE